MTIPIAPLAGLAAGLLPPVMEAANDGFRHPEWMLDRITSAYTGITGTSTGNVGFSLQAMGNGLLPLAVGVLVHKFVGGRPLNVNAALSRANVPFIRI